MSYFAHFRAKTHLLGLELISVSSSWRVYIHIKFDIQNERLERYEKRSIFAKWTVQNISDALVATQIK